jgi:hypothetical protein
MGDDVRGVAEAAVLMAILGLGVAGFLAPILFVWRALA